MKLKVSIEKGNKKSEDKGDAIHGFQFALSIFISNVIFECILIKIIDDGMSNGN